MQVHRAVNDAEAVSGLQFCVVFTTGTDPLVDAGTAFEDRGIEGRPAVLVAVAADGAVEVALGQRASGRLDYGVVDDVLALCATESDTEARVAAIVRTLADRAGAGEPDGAAMHLPDVIEADPPA